MLPGFAGTLCYPFPPAPEQLCLGNSRYFGCCWAQTQLIPPTPLQAELRRGTLWPFPSSSRCQVAMLMLLLKYFLSSANLLTLPTSTVAALTVVCQPIAALLRIRQKLPRQTLLSISPSILVGKSLSASRGSVLQSIHCAPGWGKVCFSALFQQVAKKRKAPDWRVPVLSVSLLPLGRITGEARAASKSCDASKAFPRGSAEWVVLSPAPPVV